MEPLSICCSGILFLSYVTLREMFSYLTANIVKWHISCALDDQSRMWIGNVVVHYCNLTFFYKENCLFQMVFWCWEIAVGSSFSKNMVCYIDFSAGLMQLALGREWSRRACLVLWMICDEAWVSGNNWDWPCEIAEHKPSSVSESQLKTITSCSVVWNAKHCRTACIFSCSLAAWYNDAHLSEMYWGCPV